MIEIRVKASTEYNVYINSGLLSDVNIFASELKGANKLLVVTDSNVAPLYLDKLVNTLKSLSVEVYSYIVESGEESKSIEVYAKLLSYTARCGLTRSDMFIALGGGVVGDLTGFVSASYMRGISYLQIPTTLLSAIDSSVGGKTAVNLPEGKNLVGAFHQPKGVIFDSDTLKTLPEEEYLCGIGEGIKYSALTGGRIFEILSNGLNEGNIEEFISLCVEYKANIVHSDERESGIRKYLNLGHTIGHAIEKLSGFKVKHGVGVVQGLYAILKLQIKEGSIDEADANAIIELARSYSFELESPYSTSDIVNCIYNDKKSVGNGSVSLVKLHGIGKPYIHTVEIDKLGELLI